MSGQNQEHSILSTRSKGHKPKKRNMDMTSFLEMGADNRDGKQRSGQILQCPRQVKKCPDACSIHTKCCFVCVFHPHILYGEFFFPCAFGLGR